MHNVREGVDYHDCVECQNIAKDMGLEPTYQYPKRYSYFFESQAVVDGERALLKIRRKK